jgi:hypothetical protein
MSQMVSGKRGLGDNTTPVRRCRGADPHVRRVVCLRVSFAAGYQFLLEGVCSHRVRYYVYTISNLSKLHHPGGALKVDRARRNPLAKNDVDGWYMKPLVLVVLIYTTRKSQRPANECMPGMELVSRSRIRAKHAQVQNL